MPHDKLAQLSGNRHVGHMKGTMFDHSPESTTGIPPSQFDPTNNAVVDGYSHKVNAHRN